MKKVSKKMKELEKLEKQQTHQSANIKAKDFIQILRTTQPFILDVRTKDEIKQGQLHHTMHIPLTHFIKEIQNNKINIKENRISIFARIPRTQPVYVVCFGDTRSNLVCQMLQHEGYENCQYVAGGIQGIYKALKESENLDQMSDTSFYTEEDLMVIFKIEGEYMKPDFIDAYLSQSMSPNNISMDSENY